MSEDTWTLHPQLAADTHDLGSLNGSALLLHRNAFLHWFILVPPSAVLDLLDLPLQERERLLESATRVSHYLKQNRAYPRVNVGALGLVVPQLHLHVIGRRDDDPCWPGPVWGSLPPGPAYDYGEIRDIRAYFGLG